MKYIKYRRRRFGKVPIDVLNGETLLWVNLAEAAKTDPTIEITYTSLPHDGIVWGNDAPPKGDADPIPQENKTVPVKPKPKKKKKTTYEKPSWLSEG